MRTLFFIVCLMLLTTLSTPSATPTARADRTRPTHANVWQPDPQQEKTLALPPLLSAIHPSVLAAFQLLVSITALVAFPAKGEA